MKQRQIINRLSVNLFPKSLLILILFLLLAGQQQSAFAQTQAPERGFNPGKSYSMSDIETISQQSGNLMLNIPLGSLPAGRGGMSATVGLHYNSKLYDSLTVEVVDEGTKNTLASSKEGGWHYNYKYYLTFDQVVGTLCEPLAEGSFYLGKFNVVLPDGGKHVLHLTGYSDDGLMEINPDGTGACGYGNVTPLPSGPITYYTTDGTYLRLELQRDSDPDWDNNAWTLYMPDGSRVEHYGATTPPSPNVTERIYDRNGNFIDVVETAVDTAYNNHKTTYLKDQLDRKVVIEYDAYPSTNPNQDWIHSKGFNGADVTTKVEWRTTTARKTYSACGTGSVQGCGTTTLSKTFRVVDKIYLPSQVSGSLYYEFDYNSDGSANPSNGWGEVSHVKLPSGAYSDYEYELDGINNLWTAKVLRNRPTEKSLTYLSEYDGASSSVTDTWQYSATYHQITGLYDVPATTTVTSPNGAVSTDYYVAEDDSFPQPSYGAGETWKSVQADGSTIEKYYQSDYPISPYQIGNPNTNRYVKYEFVSITDGNLTSGNNYKGDLVKTAIKEYEQDKNGNTTKMKEYDYVAYSSVPRDSNGRPTGLPSNASSYLKRITKTDYYNDTPDASSTTYTDTDSYHLAGNPRLLRLAKSSEVQNASGTPQTRSEITYDYTGYSSNTKGGNPTETKSWDSYKGNTAQTYSNPLTSTNSISTTAAYDTYGNPTLTTDAMGVQTTITYGSISAPGGSVTGLYPTQMEIASNYSTLKRTSTTVYDFYTGLATSTTDEDNDVTSATEYDPLGRPTKAIAALNTSLEVWTQTEYDDQYRKVIVKSDLEVKGDAKKIGVQHYDQLGRVRLSRTIENAATESATNEQHGIKVQTRYMTNGDYSYQLTSNPYRANYSSNASAEPSMGWTRSKSIKTGKHSEVETFSGATLPYPFLTSGYNTNTTGVVKTEMDADRTLVTDQAGKQRISKSNALGHLKDVWEIMSTSDAATVSISFPGQSGIAYGYHTSYDYDLLNNLTQVYQPIGTSGGQTRTFSYSNLSRLLSAANPESGTIAYQYDANGNLTKKTDARAVQTNYTYDALNRVTQRSYAYEPSGQTTTPTVTYTYDDTNVPKSKGRLTKVSSSLSTTEYQEFDLLGRVKQSRQTTDGTVYNPMTYVYNLSGALIEETYPSGRVVKNVLDADGELEIVQSKKNQSAGYWNYAQNFTYTAAGVASSMQLGNGRWESTQFNSRLQPTQIALGTTQSTTDLLKLDYTYGTNQNNGNVQTQIITVPTVGSATGFTATQTYTYDNLNRIKDAKEMIGTTEQWKQTFTYDRYGNRSFDEGTASGNYLTTTLMRGCSTSSYNPNGICSKKSVNPTFASSNRINQNQDSTNDYAFDSSGNTTKSADGNTYIYDGENKQIEVKNSSNQTIGQYWYDGDGKRVKKYVPGTGETTIFVYDASGKMVAEYSTIVESTSTAKVSYLTNDNLGSPRINTDQNGAVIARHDYQPFGEEISTSQRIAGLGYSSDTVRKQFTGYERDIETDLDFAQARMYSNKLGRFTSPDPLYLELRRLNDPQRLNLFLYAKNNPLLFIDPDGLDIVVNDKTEDKNGDEDYLKTVNSRKGKQFGLGYDKNNKLIIVDSKGNALNKKDLAKLGKSNLSGSERELFKAITDEKNHATLNIVRNDPSVTLFGKNEKDGENTLDVGDLAVLDSSNKTFTASNVALHETLEAYTSARLKSGFDPAHNFVNPFFPGLEQPTNTESTYSDDRKFITGGVVTFPINGGRGNLEVTYKYVTKIPVGSIPKNLNLNLVKAKEKP